MEKNHVQIQICQVFLIGLLAFFPCSYGFANPFNGGDVKVGSRISEKKFLEKSGTVEGNEKEEGNEVPVASISLIPWEYVITSHDTLSGIAKKYLGNPRRYWEIVRLNARRYPSLLKNPNLIFPGWKILMPNKLTQSESGQVKKKDRNSGNPSLVNNVKPPISGLDNPLGGENLTPPISPNEGVITMSGENLIDSKSRVLHIGDSHTVGVYGRAIDNLMRLTGAKVETVGVSGSSPSWWLKGTTTHSGYFSKNVAGNIDQPVHWRTPRKTPDFRDLIERVNPSVIVVSLGANLIGSSENRIQSEVRKLLDIAKSSGATIVWVGPPNGRAKSEEKQERLYSSLKKSVEPYGKFIDSRPFTAYPAIGGDGIHFSGKEGSAIAKGWAKQVFNSIQN